jgi:hypothetical protein
MYNQDGTWYVRGVVRSRLSPVVFSIIPGSHSELRKVLNAVERRHTAVETLHTPHT